MFMSITGEQLRAARAMLRWEQSELAQKSGVSEKTVKRHEATNGPIEARTHYSIKNALELAGIEFLDAEDHRGRGDGVRFTKDKTAKLRRKLVDDVASWMETTLKSAVEKDEDIFERPTEDVVHILLPEIKVGLARSVEQHLRKQD